MAADSSGARSCNGTYCRREGLEVVGRFKEEGESAKSADRTELQCLLTFCRENKGKVHFVVVFNLTRFARDKYDPLRPAIVPQIARHLAAIGDGAD